MLDRVVFWVKTVDVMETHEDVDGTLVRQQVPQSVPTTLRHGLIAAVLLLVTFTLGKNLPALLEITLLNQLPFDKGGRHAISVIMHYSVALTGVLLACRTLNIDWSSIQWLAAGITVGLGFGLQEIFANFVSGLILLFERPIRVGDIITLGDVTGSVTNIRIRATTVTNWDRKELIVPNKELVTGRLLNWTLSDTTNRIVIEVGLAYHTETERARQILLATVREHPNVLKDPEPNVTFEGFGDSTLTFVVRAYVATMDVRLQTIHELHTRIFQRLQEAQIEIAFPQRDVNLRLQPPCGTAGRAAGIAPPTHARPPPDPPPGPPTHVANREAARKGAGGSNGGQPRGFGLECRCGGPPATRARGSALRIALGQSASRSECCGWRIVTTGQDAVRTTRSATLPISRCLSGPYPCVPMTIISACCSLASVMISKKGGPTRTARLTVNFWLQGGPGHCSRRDCNSASEANW